MKANTERLINALDRKPKKFRLTLEQFEEYMMGDDVTAICRNCTAEYTHNECDSHANALQCTDCFENEVFGLGHYVQAGWID